MSNYHYENGANHYDYHKEYSICVKSVGDARSIIKELLNDDEEEVHFEEVVPKEEVIEIAREHSNDFSRIAKDVIDRNGFNYDVKISIGNFPFPTKHYGDISLPSGFYDALKVEIGEAKGQNWWCVMFPPLCFVDVSSGVVPDHSKQEICP